MSPQPVEAAWCIPLTQANFRVVYARHAQSDGFTKDFFQIPGAAYDATVRLLMNGDNTVRSDIDYVWPGGSVAGAVHPTNEPTRLRMKWPTNDAPAPWKPTPSPSATTIETFPGDPTIFEQGLDLATAEAKANQVWTDARARGIDAWAVAVKLSGEEGRLHTRMYLVDPPVGYEWASIDLLPPALQAKIRGGNNESARVHVFEWPVRAHRLVEQIFEALDSGPNVLLTGPPGTGKTVALEDLRSIIEGEVDQWQFDPSQNHDAWSQGHGSGGQKSKVVSLVFHPSSTYETFVLGVFPSADTKSGIEIVPGPLLELAHYAEEPGHRGLLIIDEFNRGRAAAIFGDTLALLDGDKRSDLAAGTKGSQITRRYASKEVTVSEEFRRDASDDLSVPSQVSLPRSLSIIAAMNSSDRSVAVLDNAMRRRFSIIEVGPDYEVLARHYDIDPDEALPDTPTSPGHVKLMAHRLLTGLNERIRAVSGFAFELGQALVWTVSGETLEQALDSLAHAFDQRVIATMKLTYRDETDLLGAILRAPETGGTTPDPTRLASWVDAPPELQLYAPRSLHIASLLDTDRDERWGLLLPLVQ